MSKTSIATFHETLRQLGYKSYAEYLGSEHWADLNRRKTAKTCKVCRGPRQVLHHRTYKRLGHEWLADMIPLCHKHHKMIHSLEDPMDQKGLYGHTNKIVRRERKRHERRRALGKGGTSSPHG